MSEFCAVHPSEACSYITERWSAFFVQGHVDHRSADPFLDPDPLTLFYIRADNPLITHVTTCYGTWCISSLYQQLFLLMVGISLVGNVQYWYVNIKITCSASWPYHGLSLLGSLYAPPSSNRDKETCSKYHLREHLLTKGFLQSKTLSTVL